MRNIRYPIRLTMFPEPGNSDVSQYKQRKGTALLPDQETQREIQSFLIRNLVKFSVICDGNLIITVIPNWKPWLNSHISKFHEKEI